ncbi:2-dehydropantoate 2-reductase [Streptomonospora wellingtoniae]|uniref:2-dehydropantoate 2-reductase n=1 Tax=Streptomonospora wellingtoniae TaxID=3075544 RepID=A0ABU2KUN2_9ACTN|nr:2-dehydropantoate 2-reductase [Streptomonospora sp. DSM 45055]MDT0303006.1 2-dehydropantoate 2-reductase [Streptomonospora sp. DSM 45055]
MTRSTRSPSAAALPLERPQRAAVVGAGAVGTVVAEAVHAAGHRVTLCARRPLESPTVERDGVRSRLDVPVATRAAEVDPGADWVLVATKAQDTPHTVGWIRHLAGPSTRVVALQNGIDHHDRFAPLLASGRLVPALVYISAERLSRSHVLHRWGRRLVVPRDADGADFAELLGRSSIEVVRHADFTTAAWGKLLTNAAANPLTALTQQRMHVLHQSDMRELAHGLLTEAVAAGRAEGAALSGADARQTLDLYDGLNPQTGTSMLADRLAGRPLEYDLITGAVVRAGDRHGVPVPLSRAVLALLRAQGGGASRDALLGLQPRPS